MGHEQTIITRFTVRSQFGKYYCTERICQSTEWGDSFKGIPADSLIEGFYPAPKAITIHGPYDEIEERHECKIYVASKPRSRLAEPAPDAHLEAAYEQAQSGE